MNHGKFCLRAALAGLALVGAAAQAADPATAELNETAVTVTWAGSGPYVLPNVTPDAGEPVCGAPQLCDEFALTVNLSDEFRKLPENQRENVSIAIDFTVTPLTDFELYVYGPSGALVAESSSGPGILEAVTIPLKTLKNGAYTITVVPYLPLGSNYSGTVQIGRPAAEAPAALLLSPQSGSAPLTVTLDARSLPGSGYVFEFGDGSPAVSDDDGLVEHVYQQDGDYLARVNYSGAGGKNAASAAQPVSVGAVEPKRDGAMGGAFGGMALLGLLGGALLRRRARSR